MKIASAQTYLTLPAGGADGHSLIKPFLFVRLETTDGIVGWGEAFTLGGRERGIEEIILSLGRTLMTHYDISPRSFRKQIARAIEAKHGGLDYSAAVSAIDIALWDLLGKQLNAPLHQLLGGPLTRQVPLYANTWNDRDTDVPALTRRCLQLVEDGYHAVKIYPLKFGSAQKAGECMQQLRESLGDEIDILLDLSAPDNPGLALQTARHVAAYNPYWFEEPVCGEDIESLAEIRRQTGLRIVTGEKQSGKSHFRDVLKSRAADVLNPDIAGAGGILGLLEIAAHADAHSVFVSPHCWDSMTVALAAMLHVCAVIPNAEMAEIFPDYFAHGEQFCRHSTTFDNGVATLSNAAGLGIEINQAALADIASCHNA